MTTFAKEVVRRTYHQFPGLTKATLAELLKNFSDDTPIYLQANYDFEAEEYDVFNADGTITVEIGDKCVEAILCWNINEFRNSNL